VQKFPSRRKSCKLDHRIPVNYADEFRELFGAAAAAAYIPWDSVVGVGSRLWVGRSRVQIPTRGRIFFFSKTSRPGLWPAQLIPLGAGLFDVIYI
jgi:hypothetical protein